SAEAFLRVFALEELLLQLALDGERGLERDLPTGLDGTLDASDGLRGFVRRAEALRVFDHAIPPLLAALFRRPDVVDDAEPQRFFEFEKAALDHQLDRFRLADESRQPLCSARAGQNAEGDFRQSDFAGALQRDADVRGHR